MVIKIGVPNLYSKDNEDLFLKRVELTLNKTLKDDKEFIDELLKEVNKWPVVLPLYEYLNKEIVETRDKQIKKWIE